MYMKNSSIKVLQADETISEKKCDAKGSHKAPFIRHVQFV